MLNISDQLYYIDGVFSNTFVKYPYIFDNFW